MPAEVYIVPPYQPLTKDQRIMILSCAELSEAVKDLMFATLSPETEARAARIGGCIAGIERAVARLRVATPDAA